MAVNPRLAVFSESFSIYFGLEVVKQSIQSKKRAIDVNKVFGASITVHFSQSLIRG